MLPLVNTQPSSNSIGQVFAIGQRDDTVFIGQDDGHITATKLHAVGEIAHQKTKKHFEATDTLDWHHNATCSMELEYRVPFPHLVSSISPAETLDPKPHDLSEHLLKNSFVKVDARRSIFNDIGRDLQNFHGNFVVNNHFYHTVDFPKTLNNSHPTTKKYSLLADGQLKIISSMTTLTTTNITVKITSVRYSFFELDLDAINAL